jgi:chromosome segregation ATPase
MNKKLFLFIMLACSFAGKSLFAGNNVLPAEWANTINYFDRMDEIPGEYDISTAALSVWTTNLNNFYNSLQASHIARNAELDCVSTELKELYDCVQTCNNTQAQLEATYSNLVAKITADKNDLSNKKAAIDAEIIELSNLLTTLDEAQRMVLLAKLNDVKGFIDSISSVNHVQDVRDELVASIGLDCN